MENAYVSYLGTSSTCVIAEVSTSGIYVLRTPYPVPTYLVSAVLHWISRTPYLCYWQLLPWVPGSQGSRLPEFTRECDMTVSGK